jgi:hypothetical protein
MSLLAVEVYRNAGRGQPRVHANYLDVVSHGQLPEAATVTGMDRVVASLLSNIVSIVSLHP